MTAQLNNGIKHSILPETDEWQAKYYKFNCCLSKSTSNSSDEINTNLLVLGPPSLNFLLLVSFLSSKANTALEKYISYTLTFKESEPEGTAFLHGVFIFSLFRDHSAADKYLLVSPILKKKQKPLPSWPTATQFPLLVSKQLSLERAACSYHRLPKFTSLPQPHLW